MVCQHKHTFTAQADWHLPWQRPATPRNRPSRLHLASIIQSADPEKRLSIASSELYADFRGPSTAHSAGERCL